MPNHASGNAINQRLLVVEGIKRDADKLMQTLDNNGFVEASAIMSLAVDVMVSRMAREPGNQALLPTGESC